jgi:chloride channel protein, CIC family
VLTKKQLHTIPLFLSKLVKTLKAGLDWTKDKLTHKQFIFLSSVLVGISVGFAAIALKGFLNFILWGITNNSLLHSHYFYAVLPITGIFLSVLVLNKFYGNSKFKGLGSLYKSIKKKSSLISKNQMHAQIITSSLTVGFGGSAGVEAPIVLTGAAYGSNYAKTYRLSTNDRTLLLACGVSAGIGSAFNAPIAGVLFALEVLLIDVSITAFIPLIIAAASGALIAKIFLGSSIILSFHNTTEFDYVNVFFYILLGILAGLISVYHARIFSKIETALHKKNNNQYTRVIIGGSLLAALILIFPSLYGEGYESIKWLSSSQEHKILTNSIFEQYTSNVWIVLLFIGVLIFVKAIATGLTLGSGGNGGNFAPSLFVGAYLGFFLSKSTNTLTQLKLPESNFTLVGMAGILSGLYHAPLTAIFLIAEITGGYTLMIPLMIVSSISYAISHHFEPLSMDLRKIVQEGDIIAVDKDQDILTSIHLSQIIENNYPTIKPNQTMGELIEIIKHSSKNIFPVIDKDGSFHGMILVENIKEIMFSSKLYPIVLVQELMTKPTISATSHESIESITKKLEENNFWFLPVIDNLKFQGFISKNKLFSTYREKLKDTIIE